MKSRKRKCNNIFREIQEPYFSHRRPKITKNDEFEIIINKLEKWTILNVLPQTKTFSLSSTPKIGYGLLYLRSNFERYLIECILISSLIYVYLCKID